MGMTLLFIINRSTFCLSLLTNHEANLYMLGVIRFLKEQTFLRHPALFSKCTEFKCIAYNANVIP